LTGLQEQASRHQGDRSHDHGIVQTGVNVARTRAERQANHRQQASKDTVADVIGKRQRGIADSVWTKSRKTSMGMFGLDASSAGTCTQEGTMYRAPTGLPWPEALMPPKAVDQGCLAWRYSSQIRVPCVSFRSKLPVTNVIAATIMG